MHHHDIGNLLECRDVGTCHQIIRVSIGLGVLLGRLVDVLHDAVERPIHFLEGPLETLGSLRHFQ